MKNYIILLLTLSTLSYAMEHKYNLLPQDNDEIVIPMKQQKTVTSLKKLTAQYIAKNFTQFDKTSFDTKLNKDCKKLIKLEMPLTKDNAWKIYTKNEERQKECLEFLKKQHNLASKIIFSPRKLFHSSYSAGNDTTFFSEKIKNDLEKQNIVVPKTKINELALYCATQIPKDNEKLHKMTYCCNCVIVTPCVICCIACFFVTFLVLVTVGTPAFPFH
ncbi:MAG: hypothetical protein AB7R69_03940 [Candidatus Babeliales bacterium]